MAQRIIFSNYGDMYDEDDIRQELFSMYADDEGWETPDDISDEDVWNEIRNLEELDWDDFSRSFGEYINNSQYGFVLTGYVGMWNGRGQGGIFVDDFKDLYKFWSDCDYIKVYTERNHMYIECSHHDGSNFAELREITALGSRYRDNHYWDADSETIEKIANNSKYSKLPARFEW